MNLLVVLVPLFGLELARLYERQLLDALERDMLNQASLVRVMLEAGYERGEEPVSPASERLLERAASRTRTRIRLLLPEQGVVADSHRNGPPEGREEVAPLLVRERVLAMSEVASSRRALEEVPIPERGEVRTAFEGSRATATRYARRPPAVCEDTAGVARTCWGCEVQPPAAGTALMSDPPGRSRSPGL